MGTRRTDSPRLPATVIAAIYGCQVNPDDVEPLRLEDGDLEPLDPSEFSNVQFERSADKPPRRSVRTRWVVVAAVVIVVVGMVVGIVVFNASAPDAARGAESAKAAATEFVAAVNAGNLTGAAAISCDPFADEARSAARSGKDPSIRYTLDSVRKDDKTSATAAIVEHLKFRDAPAQEVQSRISVLRSSGRWLMCGRAS